jgi:error-prone DNA polymerase
VVTCDSPVLKEKGLSGASLALRLGFRQVGGLGEDALKSLVERRHDGYADLEALARRSGLAKRHLLILADADAFRSLGLHRRDGLWAVRRLPDDKPLPLFAAADANELGSDAAVSLPLMARSEEVVADYQTLRLSLKGHPVEFLRARLIRDRVLACRDVASAKDGSYVRAAGVVLVRQRPGSASGVIFMTLEDETGIVNVVVWPAVMKRFRREVMGSRLIVVAGRIQRSPEGVVHLVAQRIVDRTRDLTLLSTHPSDFAVPQSRADEVLHPGHDQREDQRRHHSMRHPRDVRILPKSRDFH